MLLSVAALLATTLSLRATAFPNPDPATDTLMKRYAPGWCGMHVTQYQQNEGPNSSTGDDSNYRLTVTLKDATGAAVGGVALADVRYGGTVDVTSQLPAVMLATVLYNDNDPIGFAYNGQNFASDSPQCSFGKYDGGARNGDCGFTC